jgi:hypothetical protein
MVLSFREEEDFDFTPHDAGVVWLLYRHERVRVGRIP